MDIEQLNKSQIILLALLVSFVTSIATGIVTVTLMDQAPEGVTRTITHVVERTVDTVKPGTTQVATVVREVPVVVTEEELVVKAINIASPSVVALSAYSTTKKEDLAQIGTAFLVSSTGRFITSGNLVEARPTYSIKLENGTTARVKLSKKSTDGQVAVLTVIPEDISGFTLGTKDLKPLSFSNNEVSVGQSVVGVGSSPKGNHSVAVGIVSNLVATSSTTASLISTSAAATSNIGGPLIDVRGQIVGLNLSAGEALAKKALIALIDELSK